MDILIPVALLGWAAFAVHDAVRPARTYTTPRFWKLRGLAWFVGMMTLNGLLGAIVPTTAQEASLFGLYRLGTVPAALIAFLLIELLVYWVHRANHRFPALWRWVHQTHHSAEGVDSFSAFIFHPNEIVLQTLMGNLVLYFVLGTGFDAAMIVNAALLFLAAFQHANIRTPTWLGYLVQRPEAHALHHARGIHAYNYSDIGIWDIVFGTFRNPARWESEAGFHLGGSTQVGALFLGRDIDPQNAGAPLLHVDDRVAPLARVA